MIGGGPKNNAMNIRSELLKLLKIFSQKTQYT